VDAGMGFNNPAGVIVEEAGRIWGDDFGHLDPNKDISIFLTLGTGFKNVIRFDADTFKEKVSAKLRVPLKAVEVMKEIVTGTETQHTSLRATFQARLDIYHRFNVEQGLQDVELYDYQQTEAIQTDTENYLTSKSVELTTCVIEMAKFSLKQKLLETRDNSEEVFGATGGSDDKNLEKRLQALRM
jgi:calcium-independent phospholipase A2-gamma